MAVQKVIEILMKHYTQKNCSSSIHFNENIFTSSHYVLHFFLSFFSSFFSILHKNCIVLLRFWWHYRIVLIIFIFSVQFLCRLFGFLVVYLFLFCFFFRFARLFCSSYTLAYFLQHSVEEKQHVNALTVHCYKPHSIHKTICF